MLLKAVIDIAKVTSLSHVCNGSARKTNASGSHVGANVLSFCNYKKAICPTKFQRMIAKAKKNYLKHN